VRRIGVVVVPEHFDASTPVAGLPPLLRHALSLQAAGVERVVLAGPGAAGAPRPVAERLKIPVVGAEGAWDAVPHVVLPADVTCHRLLPSRLATLEVDADTVVRVGEPAAACFVAGAHRVEATVASIAGGETVDARSEPLAPREFVLPARDREQRSRAMHVHLYSLRKLTQGVLDRKLMRPVSQWMTRGLVATPVTPNHVTLFCGVLGLIAAGMVLLPGPVWPVVSAIILVAVRFIDCVDGELARLRYQTSKFGEWLDTTTDVIGLAAFLAAAGWRLTRTSPEWAPMAVLAVGTWLLAHALLFWTAARIGGGSVQTIGWDYRQAPRSLVDRVVRRLEFLFQIDFITVAYAALVAFGLLEALMVTQTVLSTIAIGFFLVQLVGKPPTLRKNRPQ
jgi:phosphatidylglycerophosphate synthase